MSVGDRKAIFILTILETLVVHSDIVPKDIKDESQDVVKATMEVYLKQYAKFLLQPDAVKILQKRLHEIFNKMMNHDMTLDFIFSFYIHFSNYYLSFLKASDKLEMWNEIGKVGNKFISPTCKLLTYPEKWYEEIIKDIKNGF